jgi:uncharacterized protein (TIGR03435 family)
MLQSLLVERFGLVFHHEMKNMAYYELVVAKSGLKLRNAEAAPEVVASPGGAVVSADTARTNVMARDPRLSPMAPGRWGVQASGLRGGGHRIMGRMESVADLVKLLSTQAGRPVLDGTGLTGLYDFVLDYVAENGLSPGAPQEGSAPRESTLDAPPSLSVAIEQQLGLKFEPRKGPIDVLVVDHVERIPKEN